MRRKKTALTGGVHMAVRQGKKEKGARGRWATDELLLLRCAGEEKWAQPRRERERGSGWPFYYFFV